MNSIERIYQLFKISQKVFTDSRQAKDGGIFFALKGERFDGNAYAIKALLDGADYAVVDRKELAKEPRCIVVKDVLSTLQSLANYHRKQLAVPVLAITGTNGKTTTKELITAVLSQNYKVQATKGNLNNHIGVPLTLLSIQEEHNFAVIEMGANHPGEIDFLCQIAEPDYGIITNVGKAHLEGFGSFEGVIQTKSELYRYIAKKGKGVFINTDNKYLLPLVHGIDNHYSYALKDESAQLYGQLASEGVLLVAKVWFKQGWLYFHSNLTGAYNLENILAAARIGLEFGVDPLLIKKGIESYQPSNNRSQVLKKGTATLLLDCYNANPSSMEVSIQNFLQIDQRNKVMILGDMLELGSVSDVEHQKVVDSIENSGVDTILLVGEKFMKTRTSSNILKFENVEEMKNGIDSSFFSNKFILVKGSRGIQLEKVVDLL